MLLLWLTVEWTQNIKRWHEVKKVKILRGWVGGMRRWFIYWPWVFNSLMARGKELSLNLDVLDAAEPPARVQHGKQSVVRVGGVRGDGLWSGSASAQCPGWRGAGTP